MKLYIMRHGQAATPQRDPLQGLTGAGRSEVEQVARRLADKGVHLDQVFHSDKARSQQTASIMAAHIPCAHAPKLRSGIKPNDNARSMVGVINEWQSDTLLVTHLPFAPALIELLTGKGGFENMAPGAIVCLSKSGPRWQIDWSETP